MMKNISTIHRIAVMFALSVLVLLAACQNSTDPSGTPNGGLGGSLGSGTITGKVTSVSNSPAVGVEVRAGNAVTYTNSKGEFYLPGVSTGKRVLVTFKSNSFATTQKIADVARSRTTYIDASMLYYGTRVNLNAVAGGTVTVSGASVVFPANAFVDSKGKAFTGTAQVMATYFDPTNPIFYGCFPGEFAGVRTDNSESSIESFGFINVEIMNNAEKLQLAAGKPAQITMPIPAAIRAKAPATIPLWYYDETRGKWIEEGSATKQGNNYVGTVAHFSSWNCDQPTQTSYLEGHVVDANGNPLSFANVKTTGADYTGSSSARTDDAGYFKVPVKSTSSAKVVASYYIITGTEQTVATPATGTVKDIGNLVVPVDTASFCNIIGRVLDNGNFPIGGIYVILKDANGKQIDYLSTGKDGRLRFFGEAGKSYTLEFSWYTDSTKKATTLNVTCPATPGTVDVGDVKLDLGGALVTGRVVDSTGTPIPNANVYSPNSSGSPGQNGRESSTDANGRFSLSAKPNITFQLHVYWQQKSKVLDVTSGNLGSTTDVGDITM